MTLTAQSPPDEVAAAIVVESLRRGHSRDETIAELSTGLRESGLRMVWSPNRQWFGYYQQDASYPNRADPMGNILGFLDRLDIKRGMPGASPDPFKNIFWLQQRPADATAETAYARGRKAYLTEIRQHIARATELYDRFAGEPQSGGTAVGWSGDPVWLEDVLRARPLLKDKVRVLDGWDERGHGDFADVWGVMWHHTGNGRATAESIRDGRPDLPGPVSNIHIGRDGIVTLVAVGVAWHAGIGSGFGLPVNDANDRLIGIECAWPLDTSITEATQTRERWPDAQIISMREVGAAITLKLGYGAERNITHKEWAKQAQGKWDPGNLDPNWFRGEIAKSMRGDFGTTPQPIPPTGFQYPSQEEMVRQIWEQLFGPQAKGFPDLFGKTADGSRGKFTVEGIADIHRGGAA